MGPRDVYAEHDRAQREAGLCPFQVDKLCTAHSVRPLGCRVFFCQEGTQAWQQDVYESFQNDLRALHERHSLTYAYLEWRGALATAYAQLAASIDR